MLPEGPRSRWARHQVRARALTRKDARLVPLGNPSKRHLTDRGGVLQRDEGAGGSPETTHKKGANASGARARRRGALTERQRDRAKRGISRASAGANASGARARRRAA